MKRTLIFILSILAVGSISASIVDYSHSEEEAYDPNCPDCIAEAYCPCYECFLWQSAYENYNNACACDICMYSCEYY